MLKLSKKELTQEAKKHDAIKIAYNVYDMEVQVYFIENCTSKLIKQNKRYNYNCYKIAYSAGIAGNNGLLYRVEKTTKKSNILKDTFYIYY